MRESEFLKSAITAVKEKNAQNFRIASTKLKQFTDFDKWKINMFTKVMEKCETNTFKEDTEDYK